MVTAVPLILAYCPPLKPGLADLEYSTSDYYTIHSQADADQLKTCYTFEGELFISGRDATGPLIIDGPRRINGELTLDLYSGPENPNFTSVTMQSLTSVHGTLSVHTARSGAFKDPPPKPPVWNLGVLNFPALNYVAPTFSIGRLESVHTINLPVLEHYIFLSVIDVPELHTINAPNVAELGELRLINLPSLTRMPSLFDIDFKAPVRRIEISRTGLTNVYFPHLKVLTNLIITDNKHLTTVSLPAITMAAESMFCPGGDITVAGNNADLVLSLPKLETATGTVSLSGLREVEIPELRTIGQNPNPGRRDGSLLIGAEDEWWSVRCTNYPTYLTTFTAPSLIHVQGRIQFDNCADLTNITFPVLKYAKEFMTNNTAAMELASGISTPSLRRVKHVQILGTRISCDFWENLYCAGGVQENFSCGRAEACHPNKGWHVKQWPSFPPGCMGKKILPLPAEEIDMKERLGWVSGFIFEDCRMNYSAYCVPGQTIRTRFLVFLGFFVFGTLVLWYIFKRWLRNKRRQSAERAQRGEIIRERQSA